MMPDDNTIPSPAYGNTDGHPVGPGIPDPPTVPVPTTTTPSVGAPSQVVAPIGSLPSSADHLSLVALTAQVQALASSLALLYARLDAANTFSQANTFNGNVLVNGELKPSDQAHVGADLIIRGGVVTEAGGVAGNLYLIAGTAEVGGFNGTLFLGTDGTDATSIAVPNTTGNGTLAVQAPELNGGDSFTLNLVGTDFIPFEKPDGSGRLVLIPCSSFSD